MGSSGFVQRIRELGTLGSAVLGVGAATLVASAFGVLDPMALLITLGGGIGVTAATFPRQRIVHAWRMVETALTTADDPEDVLLALKRLGRIHRVEGLPALERAAQQVADPFLRTAIGFAAEGREGEELEASLLGEVRRQAALGESARHVVLLLGKLFPAFGLIGTLVGLALLLRNLGTATSLTAIGPGLGIAVTTTLYGAVLANVVVLPLATKLQSHLERRHAVMEMIVDGTLMVQQKEYPTHIERVLRGAFALAPSQSRGASRITLAERAA